MTKVICPKCGMAALGGSGFWGHTKPYCRSCGWNLRAARQAERDSLKQFLWGLPLIALYFILRSLLSSSNSGFPIAGFIFLMSVILAGTAASWLKLKRLETAYKSVKSLNSFASTPADRPREQASIPPQHYLLNLSKPRPVRLKLITRIIAIALPFSWIFIVLFGYLLVRHVAVGSGKIGYIGALLFFSLVWSSIGITAIRNARRDRQLLAEGDFAFATITHQKSSGGRRPQSKIQYKFRDAAGQAIESEGTDHSWALYEDMKVLVFYKPGDSAINIPLCGASCELKMD